MYSILNNPFRILGLPVNSAEKLIKKNIQNFEVFLSIGQNPKQQETDFEFMGILNRNSQTLNETIRQIEAPKDRINYSLFWFSKVTETDIEAFLDLKNNDINEAIEKWESTIISNQINKNNFTSYKNLGLLYYYRAFNNGSVDLKSLRKSITLYGKSFNSTEFWELYITHFNNSILLNAGNQNDTLSYLFRTIFAEIQQKYNIEEDVEFVKTLINHKQIPGEFREEIVSSLVYDKIAKSEAAIEDCNRLCNINKSHSYNFGNDLYNNINADIHFIRNILGEKDYRFQMLSDKVANEFLDCAIMTFNNGFDERYTNTEVETLINYASEYAKGEITKKRVNENEVAFREAVRTSSNDGIISIYFEKLEESNKRLDNFVDPYTVYLDFLIVLQDTLSKVGTNIKVEYRTMILNLSATLFRNCAIFLANNQKDYQRSKEILQKSLEYAEEADLIKRIKEDLSVIMVNLISQQDDSNSLFSFRPRQSNEKNSEKNFNPSKPYVPDNTSFFETNNAKALLWIIAAVLLIVIILVFSFTENKSKTDSSKVNTSSTTSNNNKSSSNQNNSSTSNSNKTTTTTTKEVTTKEEDVNLTDLKVTRLKTGATPYNSFFSSISSDKSSYCRLTLINETDEDALVSLVKNSNDKVTRCVYVRSNEKYTLKNVPPGKYYMKVYKGTGWSNEKSFKNNRIKGGFKYHEDFAKFSTTVSIDQYRTSKGVSYSNGDWTLYTKSTSSSYDFNSSSSNDFFNE
ncbi:MAG: hypothetical protein ACOYN6_06615 [Ignavibacteria bacterium]